MPKKQHNETPDEQSARFHANVEKLVADGELNATEAEAALDRLVTCSKQGDSHDS